MELLRCLSLAVLAGLFASRLAKKLNLPAVTSYLVAGIVLGPYCLGRLGITGVGFVSHDDVKYYSTLCEFALGFIAFSIGNEFRVEQLRKIGKKATIIAIVQALAATLCVDVLLFVLHLIMPDKLSLPTVLTLGAIATATAPASTLMVVRQYKAKGPVTDILLPIVALDDAIGLAVFALSFGIAKSISSGEFSLISVILEPLLEIILSLALGFVMGVLFTFSEKFFFSNSKRLCLSIAFVMLTVSLSSMDFQIGSVHIGFSSLLVCMMLGTVFCNVCDFSPELMAKTDRWTAPAFILFFVLSGAELELNVFTSITTVAIGVCFILARSLGKCYGAYAGAKMVKAETSICKYLGITLLPQEGVALGMSLKALSLGSEGELIRNIVLFSVLIYELFAPYLTKMALTKAGEIAPRPETETEVKRRELNAVKKNT